MKSLDGGELMALATDIYNKHFRGSKAGRDELVSEGYYTMLLYMDRYNKSRGGLVTYLYKCAYLRMKMYENNELNHINSVVSYDELANCEFLNRFENPKEEIDKLRDIKAGNDKCQKIVLEILDGESQKNVAKNLGMSYSWVNYVWNRFCRLARYKYKYVNGELVKNGK